MPENNQIRLSGPAVFYPQEKMDAYRISAGEIYVYIVPWEHEKPGRRILLCEAAQGRVLPGLVYQDPDYKHWRLAFMAKGEEAILDRMQGKVTSVLHRNFLAKAGLDTYAQEGFEGSLAEYYKRESVKDKAFIQKAQRSAPEAESATQQVVRSAFREDLQYTLSENPTHRALGFLCQKMGIALAAEEVIAARCGQAPSPEDIARISHFICRSTLLEADWYKEDSLYFIGKRNNEVIACYPKAKGKYTIFYAGDNRREVLTPEVAQTISPQVYCIGRALPPKALQKKDIRTFCKQSLRRIDLVAAILLTLITALMGMLLPALGKFVFDKDLLQDGLAGLWPLALAVLAFLLGHFTFTILKNLLSFRIPDRVAFDLQNAAYHRLFHLPESFFRNYDSADLASRVSAVASVAANDMALSMAVAAFTPCCLVYLAFMWHYGQMLTLIAAAVLAGYTLLSLWLTARASKSEEEIAASSAAADSRLYQYLNGVDKIRMAGMEAQATLAYMKPYAQQQRQTLKACRILSAREALTGIVFSLFSAVLYLAIAKSNFPISVGSFAALHITFGLLCSAHLALTAQLQSHHRTLAVWKRILPIFQTAPENDTGKIIPGEITGNISLEHIHFGYTQGKYVIRDLNLNIKPGEYLGIVGASGCGKSTLLKILLGFEAPQSGTVTIDGKNLQDLDKHAYRQQLGVVLQNGKLINGSIYENITITAPHVSMERVNEVIALVGLKDDLAQMPMGIHTMLSESAHNISGGQQQRILIARAIVANPKVLIFDEATSALDNLTQAAICQNLDKLEATKIVVAHRLSTVRNCHRILVLKDGNIAEEGTYEALMEKKGLFYQLASRQIPQ